MGAERLSSRAIIGQFYLALNQAREASWVPLVATRIESDQPAEVFPFLSSAPAMREWIGGGRLVKGLTTQEIRIENKHFEATIEFLERELHRDRYGQTYIRIRELAARAAAHPKSMLAALLNSGESALCYDGQYFFDTDHSEGDSGAQSNLITFDVATSSVPLAQQGTTTAPSAWVLAEAIKNTIYRFPALRDDVGELMHQAAEMSFLVLLPNSFMASVAGLGVENFSFDTPNTLGVGKHKIIIETTPRLNFTDSFCVLRIDDTVKPLIWQIETEVGMKAKGEGSEFAFDTAKHQYGVDQWTNTAYGYWQYAALCRLV